MANGLVYEGGVVWIVHVQMGKTAHCGWYNSLDFSPGLYTKVNSELRAGIHSLQFSQLLCMDVM